MRKDCPQNKGPGKAQPPRGGQLKAVDLDSIELPFFGCLGYEEDGFTKATKTVKPMPRAATLNDFISPNVFNQLNAATESTSTSTSTTTTTSPTTPPAPHSQQRPQRHHSRASGGSGDRWLGPPDDASRGETLSAHNAVKGKLQAAAQGGTEPNDIDELEDILLEARLREVNILEEQDVEALIAPINEKKVKVKVAFDSGAVRNVMSPGDIPAGVALKPNETGKHFVGAGGDTIINHGEVTTMMETAKGNQFGCLWKVADVTRPLHAASQITGPADGPGTHDVLMNNRRAIVVQPGVVDKIMKVIAPIVEYERQGNLYMAEMTMSDFIRQGAAP